MTTYTPFARRFTDERALEISELRALYEEVRRLHPSSPKYIPVGASIYGEFSVAEPVEPAFCVLIDRVLKLETPIFEFPDNLKWDHLTLREQVDLRRFLRSKQYFHAHESQILERLKEALVRILASISEALPEMEGPSLFTIPLVYALPEPKEMLEKLYGTIVEQQYAEVGLFAEITDRLYRNLCKVSGREPYDDKQRKKPWKNVSDTDLPLQEAVKVYFGGTPFEQFFLSPVPLRLTQQDRFSHMHIVGGSGAGKTTLLQHLILNDLYSDDHPALIIIDSQGDLINKLSRLEYFADHLDRYVFITPKDIKHPPALNIFDVNRQRLEQYDEATKEQVTAGVIQTFDYLFSGLIGADLTAKQSVFFRFIARLMLALPETMGRNATILDLIRLMDNAEPYRQAIKSLPLIQREFFERDFASKTFVQTKEQIRYRLNSVLENPTLARLFTSQITKVDFFTELNKGSVILVDTAKDFLKGSSAHFGRIFISLVLQAVLERAAIPEKDRKPAFLIVDEAASYFDSNIDDLLTEARKYKLGCVFAHQFLDQATSSLRSSLAANTTIKIAGGVSTADARAMAPDMRTTPDFIMDQPKLHFACHIRNVTPQAVSIPVSVGVLDSQPQLSGEAYERLLELNRLRVSLPREKPRDNSTAPPEGVVSDDKRHESADESGTKPSSDW